jgi:probable HAF family extracellular repeat protein
LKSSALQLLQRISRGLIALIPLLCVDGSLRATTLPFAPSGYSMQDLGPSTGGQNLLINNNGQVLDTVGFRIYSNGMWTNITVPGTLQTVSGMNDLGQVVGTYETSSGQYLGFIWQNGQTTSLVPPATVPADQEAGAFAINNSGQVVGGSWVTGLALGSGPIYDGVLWQNGNAVLLPGPPGGGRLSCCGSVENVFAAGINDDGQVAGTGVTSTLGYDAFLYQGGLAVDLGNLGFTYSYPTAINQLGSVAGCLQSATSAALSAFLFENGVMQNLGQLGCAIAINDQDLVLTIQVANFAPLSIFWSDGITYDPSQVLGTNVVLEDINDVGQFVGVLGQFGGGDIVVFTPNATPEPSGALLIGTGLLLLVARTRGKPRSRPKTSSVG